MHVSAFPGVCDLYIFTRFSSAFCISVDETLSSGTSTSFFGLETFLCVTYFTMCSFLFLFLLSFFFFFFFFSVLFVSFVGYCSFVVVIFFCWALPYIADALLFSSSFLSFEIE